MGRTAPPADELHAERRNDLNAASNLGTRQSLQQSRALAEVWPRVSISKTPSSSCNIFYRLHKHFAIVNLYRLRNHENPISVIMLYSIAFIGMLASVASSAQIQFYTT